MINLNHGLIEKRSEWVKRHGKVILLHDNAPSHTLFSNFFEIAEVLLCKRVSHWCEEVIVRWRQVKGLQQGRFQGLFASFDVWDEALSCDKITLPCLLAHSSRFSINAWFKFIIVDNSVVWVGSSSSNAYNSSSSHFFCFTLKSPLLNCWNHVSQVLINGVCSREKDDFSQPFSFD